MPRYRITRKYSCEQSVYLDAASPENAKLIADRVIFSRLGEQPIKRWFDSEEVIENPLPVEGEPELIAILSVDSLSDSENNDFFTKLASELFDGKRVPDETIN